MAKTHTCASFFVWVVSSLSNPHTHWNKGGGQQLPHLPRSPVITPCVRHIIFIMASRAHRHNGSYIATLDLLLSPPPT